MTALPHDLCACDRCADAARLILRDVYGKRCTMTEPERRRARGEREFIASPYSRSLGMALVMGEPDSIGGPYGSDCVAALLRALALQGVCDLFGVP